MHGCNVTTQNEVIKNGVTDQLDPWNAPQILLWPMYDWLRLLDSLWLAYPVVC